MAMAFGPVVEAQRRRSLEVIGELLQADFPQLVLPPHLAHGVAGHVNPLLPLQGLEGHHSEVAQFFATDEGRSQHGRARQPPPVRPPAQVAPAQVAHGRHVLAPRNRCRGRRHRRCHRRRCKATLGPTCVCRRSPGGDFPRPKVNISAAERQRNEQVFARVDGVAAEAVAHHQVLDGGAVDGGEAVQGVPLLHLDGLHDPVLLHEHLLERHHHLAALLNQVGARDARVRRQNLAHADAVPARHDVQRVALAHAVDRVGLLLPVGHRHGARHARPPRWPRLGSGSGANHSRQ
mmetsp:Transcript_9881/g.19906  ORF Transcript_9881/g.19906 Transcript_9881/m.19906 type:complete len:291 (-) Transcript_9881:15-887(-)